MVRAHSVLLVFLFNYMRSYDETLNAVVRYIEKHGKNQNTLDKLEEMLPGAWSANLIADALDILENR
jgi:hypothetical protein